MTNEELNLKLEEQSKQIETLEKMIQNMKAGGTFPYDIDSAIKERLNIARYDQLLLLPSGLQSAPLASVTSPTGGATQDSEARTAINTIISRLQTLGLIS
jgi:hypothetical protein